MATRTYTILNVSKDTFDEIERALKEAGVKMGDVMVRGEAGFHNAIDMDGFAIEEVKKKDMDPKDWLPGNARQG